MYNENVAISEKATQQNNMKEEGKYIMSTESNSKPVTDKSVEKSSKNNAKWYHHWFIVGILGVGLAGVVASTIFSCIRVFMGTNDQFSQYAVMPSFVFACLCVVSAFFAITKKLVTK